MTRSILTASGLLLTLATQVVTQGTGQNYTITASTCVAPNAFTSCVNGLTSFNNQCIQQAGSNSDKILACACVFQLGYLNCAMANCWNVVYGCEYQTIANLYAGSCSSPVPFFPAPDNAPGGCSCNLGYVLYNNTYAAFDYKDCVDNEGLDIAYGSACTCCYQATGYAALYDICPNTQPVLAAGYEDADALYGVLDPSLKQGQCASYFSKYDCNSLGYTGLGIPFMTTYNSATLGKSTLYNTNTKTLTSPASGSTFTWTANSLPYTIVAASANARAAGGSSSGKTITAGSATATGASGSSAGSAATTTSSKSGAHRVTAAPRTALTVLMMIAGVMTALY